MPPAVIGLYGVSGCGKSYLLNRLKWNFAEDANFVFKDGSEIINEAVSGGFASFQRMGTNEKHLAREQAIRSVSKGSGVTVVTGHLLFWEDEEDEEGDRVDTDADWDVYTHIIYLDIPAEQVVKYRANDGKRNRHALSEGHIHK